VARRLILDSGVLIAAERGQVSLGSVVSEDDDLAVAALTVAELRTGALLATTAHGTTRTAFLVDLLATVLVEPYDLETAEAHSSLLAHVRRTGTPRGAHDLIIAATAVSTGRILVTTDRSARFENLPGLDCIEVG